MPFSPLRIRAEPMSILLYRVDERLIHGQVVIGWGSELHPRRYLVVDDELATSEWEQELYALGLPSAVEVLFASVADGREALAGWREDDCPSVLLTRDIESMLALARDGDLSDVSINIGGIHHGPGRTDVLGYVYLSTEDRAALRELAGLCAEITAQDLPASQKVPLDTLLGPD